MDNIILCGLLFDSVSTEPKRDMAIRTHEGRIQDIKPADKMNTVEGCEVIDLSNSFVMPGLIDAHVHMNMNGEPDSDRLFLYKSVAEMTLNSLKNVQRDLDAGFTTLREAGAVAFSDVAVRNSIREGVFPGPRILSCGWSISPPGGSSDSRCSPGITGNHPHGRIVNGVPEILRAVRENFKYGADAIKLMVTNGSGYMDMTVGEINAAISIAKAHNATVFAHAYGADSIKALVKAGITSIEHGTTNDEEGIKMMKDEGVFLVPTLLATNSSVKRSGLVGINKDKVQARLSRAKNCFDMYRHFGVKIGFGTDAAIPFIGHGEQMEEFEIMIEYGFSPAEALIAATKINAELLQWENSLGTLEEGKLADIIAFNENPLEDIKAMHACSFVMKGGVVYKHTPRV